jgi:hypothetical protein
MISHDPDSTALVKTPAVLNTTAETTTRTTPVR